MRSIRVIVFHPKKAGGFTWNRGGIVSRIQGIPSFTLKSQIQYTAGEEKIYMSQSPAGVKEAGFFQNEI